jgi:hypothetical protein
VDVLGIHGFREREQSAEGAVKGAGRATDSLSAPTGWRREQSAEGAVKGAGRATDSLSAPTGWRREL